MHRPRDPELEQLARAVIARFIATERAHLGISADALSVLCYYDRNANARIEIHQKETECP